MGPGSIVVVLPLPDSYRSLCDWVPVDDEKTHYMIRDVVPSGFSGKPMAYLEEGSLGWFMGEEIGFDLEYLREVMPPDDLAIELLMEEEITA